MKTKILQEQDERTFAIVFEKGDELITGLEQFAREEQLAGSHFTAIGAFNQVTLGYFDRDALDYKRIPVEEQVEVLSLIGNVALDGGKPKIHAHVVLGKADGTTRGGHILEARYGRPWR